jgi:predicted methyltransferase
MLRFLRVEPGMTVVDASVGDAYYAEILSVIVKPEGQVLAVGHGIDGVEPESADLVLSYLSYHDLVAREFDRAAWAAGAMRILRPGGALVIVDYAAVDESGDRDAEAFGRIDEQLVVAEVQAAGFGLVEASADFRNPDDARMASTLDLIPVGSADQFALRFRKFAE